MLKMKHAVVIFFRKLSTQQVYFGKKQGLTSFHSIPYDSNSMLISDLSYLNLKTQFTVVF